MVQAYVGQKKSQTQTFTQDGKRIPVTVISAGPVWVADVKTKANGRATVTCAFGVGKHLNKSQQGMLRKAGLTTLVPRFFRELPAESVDDLTVGKQIFVHEVFSPGDRISVTGVSKGKGFAGVMKRHGFHGGPKTHGQSDRARAPGSIGQSTTPGRVYRGKRMAGRMGGGQVTVKGLRVISVDQNMHTLTLGGVVPGNKNGILILRKQS
jgi:large subunit ribosomal protein L3